jgi:hypothetical protein
LTFYAREKAVCAGWQGQSIEHGFKWEIIICKKKLNENGEKNNLKKNILIKRGEWNKRALSQLMDLVCIWGECLVVDDKILLSCSQQKGCTKVSKRGESCWLQRMQEKGRESESGVVKILWVEYQNREYYNGVFVE